MIFTLGHAYFPRPRSFQFKFDFMENIQIHSDMIWNFMTTILVQNPFKMTETWLFKNFLDSPQIDKYDYSVLFVWDNFSQLSYTYHKMIINF